MTVVEFLTSVIKGWEEHLATDPSDPIKVTRDLYVSLVTMAKAALLDAQALEAGLVAIASLPELPPKAVPGNPDAIPSAYGKPDGEKPKDFFKQLDEIDETIAEGEQPNANIYGAYGEGVHEYAEADDKKFDCVTCPVQYKDHCTVPGTDDCKARLARVAGASVDPSLGDSEASKPG